jgi:hypothetical protein
VLAKGAGIIDERAAVVLLPYAIFGYLHRSGLKLKVKR